MRKTDILKFGGTSLADAKSIEISAAVVEKHLRAGSALVVIVSAMSGVTNKLVDMVNSAAQGTPKHDALMEIGNRHLEAIATATPDAEKMDLATETQAILVEVADILREISLTGLVSAQLTDYVISVGERLIAPIFAAHLRLQGIPAVTINANQVFGTDNNYSDATVLNHRSQEKIQTHVLPLFEQAQVVIIPGFYGDNFATFGRGGSDYSATKIAELLSSHLDIPGVYLYKADVGGALSADPRIVGDQASLQSHLTYEEAHALASSSARILHGRSIEPVSSVGIPLYCRNTINPDEQGTVIDGTLGESDFKAKIVTSRANLTELTLSGVKYPAEVSEVIKERLNQAGIKLEALFGFESTDSAHLIACVANGYQATAEEITQLLHEGLGKSIEITASPNSAIVEIVGHGVSKLDFSKVHQLVVSAFKDHQIAAEPRLLSLGEVSLGILIDNQQGLLNEAVKAVHSVLPQLNEL